jgi:NAD(P)-dependent dehydrogenase (short-subunit alcohol dehydrogenase family)
MAPKLQARVYTVTGAASGIGRATAVKLAELGAEGLALSDVNEQGVLETKALCQFLLLLAKMNELDLI